MSTRHLRSLSLVTLVPAVLGLCLSAAGCGGGGGAGTSAPKTGDEAKAGESKAARDSKAGDAAPAPPPGDAAQAEEKPAAGATAKFSLPNVEITSPEERGTVTLAGKELTAEACLLDTSAPESWARDPVACTGGMFCVVDSNCHGLSAWDAKGTYVGRANIDKLLGLDYSFPSDLVMAKGGVAYLAVSHKETPPESPPKDYEEMVVGLIYRIKGLN